ncbi:purine-cytosine permease family protein [Amycolatopsis nivea]
MTADSFPETEHPVRPPLHITRTDDPAVVKQAATQDYATHVVPLTGRAGRTSLSMAWLATFSAMFWLYVAVSVDQAVGRTNAVVGMVLASVVFGLVQAVLVRYAIRSGLTVALLSRRLFGYLGGGLAPLLLGATAIYYAVFEGSVIAVALQRWFAPTSDIRIWYAIVVLYAVPLVIGGVQRWLDRLNGVLLPLYLAGLVALVLAAGIQHGFASGLAATPTPAGLALPGWVTAFMVYLGTWVLMMFAVDYARLGRPSDARFHSRVTFGIPYYLATFVLNGVIGIFVTTTVLPGQAASETGVIDAVLGTLGVAGLLFILVSQTRINTANYYVASTNLEAFGERALRLRWPRIVWSVIAGVIVFAFMLTDVLSYLLTALAWQGVFVVAWVAIALTHIGLVREDRDGVPEFRPGRLRNVLPGLAAWILASLTGIVLTEFGRPGAWYTTLAPAITCVLAALLYAVGTRVGRSPLLPRGDDPRDEVDDAWDARIRCHACQLSYTAIEMDRDPSAGLAAICAGCAAESADFVRAARRAGERTA